MLYDMRWTSNPTIRHMLISKQSVRALVNIKVRQREQEFKISRCSLQRTLIEDLRLHAYKDQLTQELESNEHAERIDLFEWTVEHQPSNGDFSKETILSNEARFHKNGFVNRVKMIVFGLQRTHAHVIIERRVHMCH